MEIDGEEYVCNDADFEIEMNYLKEKCDAGGHVILTQLFYDFAVFESFVKQCRAKGINVPILPGIMPLNAYGGFKRMTGFCKTRIPKPMAAQIAKLEGDDKKDAFVEFGIDYMTKLCKQLVKSGLVTAGGVYSPWCSSSSMCASPHRMRCSIRRKRDGHLPRLVPLSWRRRLM